MQMKPTVKKCVPNFYNMYFCGKIYITLTLFAWLWLIQRSHKKQKYSFVCMYLFFLQFPSNDDYSNAFFKHFSYVRVNFFHFS